MSTAVQTVEPEYGERVLTVEPYTIERIPAAERHGRPFHLFFLWFGANLTIADFALGFLPVSLGVPLSATIVALVLGNVLGGLLLALASAMGPRTGYPQMIAGRWPFGRVGGYLPALLNWISTVGWFTVNNILGSFGLQVLFPSLSFWVAALCLVVIQVLLVILGYNLIHVYERAISVVLGFLFLVATVIILTKHNSIPAVHLAPVNSRFALFAIVLGAAFSYIASWSPYASDYSRYLDQRTPVGPCVWWTFLGAAVASLWLELVGVFVALLAGPTAANPIASLNSVMGGFGHIAVVAIIVGATAADALNLYSNSLSARALDVKLSRPVLTVLAGIIGLIFSIRGSGTFSTNYEHFLLLLAYWITPWLAVLFVDFYLLRRAGVSEDDPLPGVRWSGLISFLLGIAVSVPFMSASLFTGPIAKLWGGADFSYYIGFIVAGAVYFAWERWSRSAVTTPVASEA